MQQMTQRIWLSVLTLLVSFCIGLSVLAIAGAAVFIR